MRSKGPNASIWYSTGPGAQSLCTTFAGINRNVPGPMQRCVRPNARRAHGSKAERTRQYRETLINWMSVWSNAVACWKADPESEGACLTRVASEDRPLRAWLHGRGTRLPDNLGGANDGRPTRTTLC